MHSISSIRFLLCSLMIGMMFVFSAQSFAQVGVGVYVNFAPPDLPVYDQPECPGPDYIWTPGYWAWEDDVGYYWVPGTWVMAPEPGYYWTPGYWAWGGNGFFFTPGYWGPVVGFYGGIDYGYGYFGRGYEGGRWDNGRFYYNRTVNNVNVNVIHNTYNTTVVNNSETRVSYNGGNGGLSARPTAQDQAATRERRIPAVSAQTQQIQAARSNPELRASTNNGRPAIAATARPGAFQGNGVVAARQAGAVHGPAPGTREAQQPNNGRPVPRPEAAPQQQRPPAPQQERPQVQQQERPRPPQQEHQPVPQQQRPPQPERPPAPQPERPQGQQQERPPAQRQVPEPPRPENRPNPPTHPNDIPPAERSAPPNTGNARLDQKYQKQQQKLESQQSRESQKLQQQQDREHSRVSQQQSNEAQKQQMEQRHQQQTQQMMQRHDQQNQRMQSQQKTPPPPVHAASRPPEQK